MTDIDIIIVNYNTKILLKQCIESLYKNTSVTTFNIIVVDNNSSDGSVEMLEANFPEITLLLNRMNSGFAKANNQGIKISHSRYILLLNSDTIILPSAIDTMKDFMVNHPQAGIIGSKTLYPDYTVQATARRFPTPANALFGRKSILTKFFPVNRFSKGYLTCINKKTNEPFEVDWVAGSCLMARREMIKLIGPLDEKFWMYWEDADWCYRAKNNSWKVYCVPKAQIIHYEGKSGSPISWKLIWEFHKSVYIFYRKHYHKSVLHPMNFIAIVGLFLRSTMLMMLSLTKKIL